MYFDVWRYFQGSGPIAVAGPQGTTSRLVHGSASLGSSSITSQQPPCLATEPGTSLYHKLHTFQSTEALNPRERPLRLGNDASPVAADGLLTCANESSARNWKNEKEGRRRKEGTLRSQERCGISKRSVSRSPCSRSNSSFPAGFMSSRISRPLLKLPMYTFTTCACAGCFLYRG